MKKLSFLFASILVLSLFSCEEALKKNNPASDKPSEQIDVAVDDAKELIDVFSKSAKEFLEGDEVDKFKDLADELKDKGQEFLKDTAIWKAKLKELSEDEEIKMLIDKYKSESGDLMKALEEILSGDSN